MRPRAQRTDDSGQSGQPGPRPRHQGYTMSTISTMRTGHHRLADGSLLRVDIELGRWVGSLYTRDLRVKTRVVGSDIEVHAWADRAKQRYELAS
jgi:hypothetical protein